MFDPKGFENSRPDGFSVLAATDLMLLFFIDDMSVPRIRVRFIDLLQQGGIRPLNIIWFNGIRLALHDPSGIWTQQSARLDIMLT